MSTPPLRLGDLRPDPANARRHDARNLDLIADALREVGTARSIVVDEDGTILAGNATVQAATQAGLTRLQVVDADGDTLVTVRRTGLTPEQKRRLALFDNRAAELAEWDAERLAAFLAEDEAALAGLFDQGELDDLLAGLHPPLVEDPGPQIDRAAELQAQWQTARGQLWHIGRHRLLVGDSTEAADLKRLMDGRLADMVFTDPPYGVNVTGKGGRAVEGDISFTAIPLFFDALGAVLGPAGWCYVCGGQSNLMLYARLFERHLRQLVRVIVWDKGRTAVLRREGYHSCYEFVYYAFREGGGSRWYAGRTSDEADDIWRIPTDADADRTHPTQKPSALAARAITNSCPPGGLVLDPFVGAGATLVAAEQSGRVCYALEIAPEYVAVCLERLAGLGLEPRLLPALDGVAIGAVAP